MNHLTEEQLVLHYYGEDAAGAEIERHLTGCPECRSDYSALQLVLNSVDSATVPERAAGYGAEVWRLIESKVHRKRRWFGWFAPGQPRWTILVPAAAMLMLGAFIAGRVSLHPEQGLASSSQVRERILLVAVGDHLDRSQMVLAELSNAPDGKGKVDISDERKMAADLLDDNRLYRQTAHNTGDTAVAGVLDDLERMLLEIANSPSQVSTEQFNQIRQQIRDRGLLFKVQVVGSQVRQKQDTPLQPRSKDSKNL